MRRRLVKANKLRANIQSPPLNRNIHLRRTLWAKLLEGVEALHMMRKGQVKKLGGKDSAGQAKFIGGPFGVAA